MHTKERRAASTAVIALLIVAVLIGGAVVVTNPQLIQGSALQVNTPTGSFTPTPTTSTTGPGLVAGDQLTLTFNHRDALSVSSSLTEATNVKSTLVNKNSGGGYVVTGSGTGQTYTLGQSDNGKAYVSWETQASGQSYVFAVDRTIAANPGVVESCGFADIDGDGLTEAVCQISTAGLKSQQDLSGTKPDRVVTVMWYNEVAISAHAADDVSSVGTSQATKFIEWKPTGTAGDAAFIARVTLTWNQTDESEIDQAQSYVNIAGTPYPLTSANKVNDGSNIIWEWLFGYTLDKAKTVEFPLNTNAKADFTTKIVVTMDEDDDYLFDLDIDTLNEVGTLTNAGDQVEIEENA